MTTNDRAPSATEGPPAGSGHRELTEESREHKQGRMGNNWPWCWACNAKWPCLPVRLADALEQEQAAHQRINLTWNDAFNWLYVALTNRLADLSTVERRVAELLDGNNTLRDRLLETDARWCAAERRAAELSVCGSWHCSGQRRCELQGGHDGRHFTTSLGNSYPGWDDSASVDVPKLLDALNDGGRRATELKQRAARAEEDAQEAETRHMLAAMELDHETCGGVGLLSDDDGLTAYECTGCGGTGFKTVALARSLAATREALAHYASRETWEQVDEFSVAGWLYAPDDEPWARAAIVAPTDAPTTRTAGAQAVLEAEDERSGMEGTQ